MKRAIALSTLLFALNASADCPSSVPTQMPAIPDGPTANEQAMLGGQIAVQAYVSTIEAYLRCRNSLLRDGSYNELIDRAITAADAYNQELQVYRKQYDMLVRN